MVNEEERTLRVNIVTALRVLSAGGIDDPIAGVVTIRHPDKKSFIASPIGIPWSQVQPDELVIIDPQLLPSTRMVNIPAVANNIGLHQNNLSTGAVIHSHAKPLVALSVVGQLIPPFSQEACVFFQEQVIIPDNHDYDPNRPEWLASKIGSRKILIIENHGIMVQANFIEDATAYLLQYQDLVDLYFQTSQFRSSLPVIPDAPAIRYKEANGSSDAARMWYFCRLHELRGEL